VEQMIVLKHVEPLVQLAAKTVVEALVMIHVFVRHFLVAVVHAIAVVI
jgi:hypothetical protein